MQKWFDGRLALDINEPFKYSDDLDGKAKSCVPKFIKIASQIKIRLIFINLYHYLPLKTSVIKTSLLMHYPRHRISLLLPMSVLIIQIAQVYFYRSVGIPFIRFEIE